MAFFGSNGGNTFQLSELFNPATEQWVQGSRGDYIQRLNAAGLGGLQHDPSVLQNLMAGNEIDLDQLNLASSYNKPVFESPVDIRDSGGLIPGDSKTGGLSDALFPRDVSFGTHDWEPEHTAGRTFGPGDMGLLTNLMPSGMDYGPGMERTLPPFFSLGRSTQMPWETDYGPGMQETLPFFPSGRSTQMPWEMGITPGGRNMEDLGAIWNPQPFMPSVTSGDVTANPLDSYWDDERGPNPYTWEPPTDYMEGDIKALTSNLSNVNPWDQSGTATALPGSAEFIPRTEVDENPYQAPAFMNPWNQGGTAAALPGDPRWRRGFDGTSPVEPLARLSSPTLGGPTVRGKGPLSSYAPDYDWEPQGPGVIPNVGDTEIPETKLHTGGWGPGGAMSIAPSVTGFEGNRSDVIPIESPLLKTVEKGVLDGDRWNQQFNPVFNPTVEGGAGGASESSINFGDYGMFGRSGLLGGNPLLGQGAVQGGNVNFGDYGMFGQGGLGLEGLGTGLGGGLTGMGEGLGTGLAGIGTGFGDFGTGLGQFGQGLGTGLTGLGQGFGTAMSGIGTGLEGIGGGLAGLGSGLATMNKGMFAPGAFDFGGLNQFENMNRGLIAPEAFSGMNTGLMSPGAIQFNETTPDWLTNPNDMYQFFKPYMQADWREELPTQADLLPEWLRGGERDVLGRIGKELFPQGEIENLLRSIVGDPLAGMQAEIEKMQSGGLLAELNKLQGLDPIAQQPSEGDGVDDDFAMAGDAYSMEAPQLDMPGITDYSQALQMPMYNNILSALDQASPYDTRRDEILGGQNAYLDEIYDEKRANLENRFAVMDNLGSPGFREAMKDLEEDRARAKLGVTSQFGQQAAEAAEPMRRGRVQDLSQALGFETGRVRDEMGFQDQLQRQSTQDFNNYMEQIFRSYMAPQDSYDNALRMMLGGLGTAIQPNIGAAMTGLGGVTGATGDMISNNQRNYQMMMNPGAFQGTQYSSQMGSRR